MDVREVWLWPAPPRENEHGLLAPRNLEQQQQQQQQQQSNNTYDYFFFGFQFNWTRYFNKLTEGLSNPITESEEIFVGAPKYLEELMKIFKNSKTRGWVVNLFVYLFIFLFARSNNYNNYN